MADEQQDPHRARNSPRTTIPQQRGIAPVSPRATLAKPESCSFKLPKLPWLTLDKQHGPVAMTPARLLSSPLQVTHPPKPLTPCQRSCCCPRAELSVPRNNGAISELPSTPAMLPHSSPHPMRQDSNIRGLQGRKSNSTEENNPKPHRLSCGGEVASLQPGHGIRRGCTQPKHPQP